jgi:pyruvate dehydrogenase E2 component (dihydrolipoamide acetyltransferase)
VAREAGYDWSALTGSGPSGRVVETDVRGALACEAREARSAEAVAAITPPGRMAAAQWTPQIHLEADCRIDALEIFRAERNAQARAAQRTRISLLDCVVKALAGALRQNPRANVARTPRGYQSSRRIDVALALSIGEEIVAPVLADAADMALEEIAAARAALLAGRFAPDAFAGGNALVANLGAFGVKRFQPVVVAPWTVVLGVGAAEKRVVVAEGALAIASVLSVTLAIDRSAMDEAAAGALIATLKRLIEHPAGLVD